MLKELIAAETREPQVTAEWRASEVGECETFLCHLRLGHPAIPFTGRVKHMLDDGLMHEHDVVDRIRGKGIKVLHSYSEGQMSVVCYDKDGVVITGHPDGVLDVGGGPVTLDYADDHFRWRNRFYGLEVTAPSHFTFMRLERNHMRSELWRKFVQIQMYLNSEEVRTYTDCMVAEVKNKNTSALYEEGISRDQVTVALTVEKLKRVSDLVARGEVSPHRCEDWRRYYCRYRELCFGEGAAGAVPISGDILDGETLSEAQQLLEAADLWLKGKALEAESKELVDDARALFYDTLTDYGVRGLTVGQVKALMIAEGISRRTNYELLERQHPDAYNAAVNESVRLPYVMVSRK